MESEAHPLCKHSNRPFWFCLICRDFFVQALFEFNLLAIWGVKAAKYLAPGIFFILLICGRAALADERLADFGNSHSAGAEPVASSVAAADPWGPVPTEKASLANLKPIFLPFCNNGPVFGMPGTNAGDFWHRTQLTGDWGGIRTDLAQHGLFFDLYSISAYQDVMSGGLKTGSAFVQNTQFSINVDTGRAGLWPGGLFHFTVESRYGSSPERTFTVGSTAPQYTGLALPGPFFSHDILPTEYFLVQSLDPKFSVLLGKLTIINIADQTLFGNSYKYYFANFNFNKNPIALTFYNTTTLAALGLWTPTDWVTIAGGVLDPNSQANNFATHAFDRVNIYATSIFSYKVGDLPGLSWLQAVWTNKPKIDLGSPFGPLSQAQIPQAVGVLLGSPSTEGLQINHKSKSWTAVANFAQYLFAWRTLRRSLKRLKAASRFAESGYSEDSGMRRR